MSNLSNEELSKRRMTRRTALVFSIVVVAVISVFVWQRIEASATESTVGSSSGSAAGSSTTSSTSSPGTGSGSAEQLKKIDAAGRKQVLDRIKSARTAREAGGGSPSKSAPERPSLPDLPGLISKDDIRKGVRAVIPLLAECYGNAAERLGNPSGKIEVKMHLTGEPDVGTLIDSADVGGDKVLTSDAELVECFQQTMLSVELPPFAEGGTVDVTYPIAFSP